MFCTACGTRMEDAQVYCTRCGNRPSQSASAIQQFLPPGEVVETEVSNVSLHPMAYGTNILQTWTPVKQSAQKYDLLCITNRRLVLLRKGETSGPVIRNMPFAKETMTGFKNRWQKIGGEGGLGDIRAKMKLTDLASPVDPNGLRFLSEAWVDKPLLGGLKLKVAVSIFTPIKIPRIAIRVTHLGSRFHPVAYEMGLPESMVSTIGTSLAPDAKRLNEYIHSPEFMQDYEA